MPQITISYKNQRTLQDLQDFAKYLDFDIEMPKNKIKNKSNKPIENIVAGNSKINITELTKIFSAKNLDATKLRSELWLKK